MILFQLFLINQTLNRNSSFLKTIYMFYIHELIYTTALLLLITYPVNEYVVIFFTMFFLKVSRRPTPSCIVIELYYRCLIEIHF